MAAAREGETKKKKRGEKEGGNLLGSPTFTSLENGRFRCVETGHELLERDKESYSTSKRCRLMLIDYAVSHKKPPLNLFKQDPSSRSKLICKLTGDVVNKSEEHIWKHLNGKQFLNKLEKKELEKESNRSTSKEGNGEQKPNANGVKEKDEEKKKKKEKKKEKKKMKKKEKTVDEVLHEVEEDGDRDSEVPDFWMPPVGERWDFDDGGGRWGSDSESGESGEEGEEEDPAGEDGGDCGQESVDNSTSRKRMSKEIDPSSGASKKKKKTKNNKIASSEIQSNS